MKFNKILFFILMNFLFPYISEGQIVIKEITIEGNKKTKDYIILQECPIKKGDTIAIENIDEKLAFAKSRIIGLGLFVEVDNNIIDWEDNHEVTLHIKVKESWYFYVFPIIELVDRNFNVWWQDHNRSLKRINYGVEARIKNTTGHNDNFYLNFQTGYNTEFSLKYSRPNITPKSYTGFEISTRYKTFDEVNYISENDKQAFFAFDSRGERAFVSRTIDFALTRRKHLFWRHKLGVKYDQNTYNPLVRDSLNTNLITGLDNELKTFHLYYQAKFNNTDIFQYPLSGWIVQFDIRKQGLGIFKDENLLPVEFFVAYFHKISPKISASISQKARINLLNNELSYNNAKSIGYGSSSVRGYERKTVEARHHWVGKWSINYSLFDKTMNLGKLMPISAFKAIPIRSYFATFVDMGYGYYDLDVPSNRLPNTLLIGYGVSLDFVVYNDFVFRFNYSFDREGNSGLFVHFDYAF